MVMELRKRKLSEAPAPQPKRKSSKRAAKKAVEKAQNTQNKARNKARDKAQDAAPQDAPQGTSKDITQNNELDAQDTKPETATLDAQDTKPETAVVETAKDAPPGTEHKENGPAGENEASSIKSTGPIKEGETVNLVGFGGEVYTDDSKKATLRELIDESRSGVVIFTYPKASTPGCKSPPYSRLPTSIHTNNSPLPAQAPRKHASFATPTGPSSLPVSRCLASRPTRPRPTPRSRRSRGCSTRSSAIRLRPSSKPLASK